MRLSKCVKYFDSKCAKIDAICANFILTLFVMGFCLPTVLMCCCVYMYHVCRCMNILFKYFRV